VTLKAFLLVSVNNITLANSPICSASDISRGGKSLVRDVYSILNAGICLTITPLLSLGADQVEKIGLKSNNSFGSIAAIHLDEIRVKHQQQAIVKVILLQPKSSNTTTFPFLSPQALVKEGSVRIGLIDQLITSERLTMVCVNEVHLFVHFGLTFRKEFMQLKTCLFNKIKMSNNKEYKTKVPVLFTTATCNTFVVDKLQAFTNLKLSIPANVFWPAAAEMGHRHVFFDVSYTIRPLQTFQVRVGPLLK
jgi:superfamily II DNA helicase RecQ